MKPEALDKAKYWELIENLEDRLDTELSLHFDQSVIASIGAQLRKSRNLLKEAKTEDEIKIIADRIRKLSDWIRFNQNIEEIK